MIRPRLLLICLTAGTILGGCQTTKPGVSAEQRLPLPVPAPTSSQEVQWGYLRAGEPAPEDVVTITPSEFDKLVANQIDLLRWVKEATAQLRYYRGEEPQTTDDKGEGGEQER